MSIFLINSPVNTAIPTKRSRFSRLFRVIIVLSATISLLMPVTLPASAAPIGKGSVLHDGGGAASHPDELLDPSVYRGDLESSQWHLPVIGEDLSASGIGVTVAVIGDSIWAGFPDLQGRVLAGYDTVNHKTVPVVTDREFDAKDSYIGTFAAGLIAGSADKSGIRGIAPQSKLLPVVVTDGKVISDSTIAEGIIWAANNGANVILLLGNESIFSVAGDESRTCAAITKARDLGILTVTSASSRSRYTTTTYIPARCADVISVAGVSATFGELAGETNDVIPTLSAPATRLASLFPDLSYFPYRVNDSSDWSAALVAGAAASVLSKFGALSPTDLTAKLTSTAVDLNTPGIDASSGYGLIDVAAATGSRSPRNVSELRSASLSTSIANVTDLTRDGTGKTSISWEPPTNAKVTTYHIVVTTWDGQRWKDVRYPVSGDVVRTVLNIDVNGESFVAVNAIVDGIERPGFPDAWVDTDVYIPAPHIDAKITKISGVWGKAGLSVSVERNDIASGVLWNVAVLDPTTQQLLAIRRDIKSSEYTLYFAVGDSWREQPVLLYGWIGGNQIKDLIWPQYALDAEGYAAGKSHAAVSGRADFACLEESISVACEGTLLKIIDTKTKKVLATTIVLEDLTFSAVFPWKAFDLRVQVIGPKGVISKPITKGLTWRK